MTQILFPPDSTDADFSFACDRRALARIVRHAARLVGGGRRAEERLGVWLRVGPDRLTLTCSNPPVTLVQHLPVSAVGHGEIVVAAHNLRFLVLSRRSGTVEVSGGPEGLDLRSGRFWGRIVPMPPEWTAEPRLPVDPIRTHVIGSYRFRDGLAHTALSVAHWRAWRPGIAGLEISTDGGRLRFAATDLATLAVADFPRADVDAELESSIVVPAEALDALGRFLPPRRRVEVRVGRDQVDTVAGDTEIRVETEPAPFPDHRTLRLGETTRRATVRRFFLRRALDRVAAFGHGNPPGRVWLEFGADRITVRTLDREVGSGSEAVPAALDGEPCLVGLNLWTLIACLRALDGKVVVVEIGDPRRRVTWYTEDHPDRRYHMLPLAIDGPFRRTMTR